MEKLIELLNEYSKENKRPADFEEYFDSHFFGGKQEHGFKWSVDESVILSKKYGFIQRLVENDKIDLLRLDNRIALSEFNKVERVLMALAISDTPIDDLISYLK